MNEPSCPNCARMLQAVVARGAIEQSKGMLMQAFGVDADEAFDRIRRWSRTNNVRVYEVTHRIVAGKIDVATFAE